MFDALIHLTALTAVTLGTLPLLPAAPGGAPPPAPQPAPTIRLPAIRRLTVSAPRWVSSGPPPWQGLSPERQKLMGLDGTHTALWVDALPAFPGLQYLTLDTGAARAEALLRLPGAAPALRELSLPPRLHASVGGGTMRELGRMSGLERLRVGWKAALDEGPPAEVCACVCVMCVFGDGVFGDGVCSGRRGRIQPGQMG